MKNTLIPMTQFVLMLRGRTTSELCRDFPLAFKMPKWKGSQIEMVTDMLAIDAKQWDLVGEYAKFLSQPLTLGMFIPCNEEGEVLEEPKHPHTWASENADEYRKKYDSEMKAYKAAKERVLFEGFEWEPIQKSVKSKTMTADEAILKKGRHTVEDLIVKVILTLSALKQIGINEIPELK